MDGPPLMSPLNPALGQRHHSIDEWQQVVSDIAVLSSYFVEVTMSAQLRIRDSILFAFVLLYPGNMLLL
jgi:hypothetical protein